VKTYRQKLQNPQKINLKENAGEVLGTFELQLALSCSELHFARYGALKWIGTFVSESKFACLF